MRKDSMCFLFLTEILAARRKKRVIRTAICGHQSWLIVNSEVKWVERSDRILNSRNVSNKTTFLI